MTPSAPIFLTSRELAMTFSVLSAEVPMKTGTLLAAAHTTASETCSLSTSSRPARSPVLPVATTPGDFLDRRDDGQMIGRVGPEPGIRPDLVHIPYAGVEPHRSPGQELQHSVVAGHVETDEFPTGTYEEAAMRRRLEHEGDPILLHIGLRLVLVDEGTVQIPHGHAGFRLPPDPIASEGFLPLVFDCQSAPQAPVLEVIPELDRKSVV